MTRKCCSSWTIMKHSSRSRPVRPHVPTLSCQQDNSYVLKISTPFVCHSDAYHVSHRRFGNTWSQRQVQVEQVQDFRLHLLCQWNLNHIHFLQFRTYLQLLKDFNVDDLLFCFHIIPGTHLVHIGGDSVGRALEVHRNCHAVTDWLTFDPRIAIHTQNFGHTGNCLIYFHCLSF